MATTSVAFEVTLTDDFDNEYTERLEFVYDPGDPTEAARMFRTLDALEEGGFRPRQIETDPRLVEAA